MNTYKTVILFLVLCISLSTQASTRALSAMLDYGWMSIVVGATSFELNRLEQSMKQLRFQEEHVHDHPYNNYNLEIARSNVTTLAYSSGALSLVSIYALLHRPWTFGYTCMRLVTVLNIMVGILLANDYCDFDKKYQDYMKQS